MGTKWNGLNRNNQPRKVSKKKTIILAMETKIKQRIKYDADGVCQVCGLRATPPSYQISVHEKVFKSAGGVVSEENSVASCDICHTFLQSYRLYYKGQCLRVIMQVRNVSYDEALEIYKRIREFAEKHGLLRESKIKQEEKNESYNRYQST